MAPRADRDAGAPLLLPRVSGPGPVTLNYSQFVTAANQHRVKDVTFGSSSNGGNTAASGTLTNGKSYTTVIPGAPTTQLANQLRADGVKSVEASVSSPGLGAEHLVLADHLRTCDPRVLAVPPDVTRRGRSLPGRARRVGRSRAKVFDAERPSTKFADVAGYEARRRRSARSSTSCAIRAGTSGPARWRRAAS